MSHLSSDLRLKPRLLMLIHSSKVLLQAIADQPQDSFQELRAQAAVQWDWEGAKLLPQVELISAQSLSLPTPTLTAAQIRVQAPDHVQAATQYQFPRLTWELLDPQNTVQERLTIPGGRVKTPNNGRLNQFLQEYLATLLDFELSAWKFSCRRQKQTLEIRAGAEWAGWNLHLAELTYDSETVLPWSGGLYQGLSSLDPTQQAGQVGFLWWGPYLINSQHCEICLPFTHDLAAFARDFLEALNTSLAVTGIQASWTAEGKLALLQQNRGQEIDVQQPEDAPALKPPHQYLALDLALGKHSVLLDPKQESLCLNQVEIDLPTPPGALAELSDWLIETINAHQHTTGVMMSLDSDQHLVLHSLKPFASISVSGLSSWLKKCSGLSESLPAAQQHLQTGFEQWLRLLNALGQESVWRQGLPLEACLAQDSHLLSWNSPEWEFQPQLLKQTAVLSRFVNEILRYAQSFVEATAKEAPGPEKNDLSLSPALQPPQLASHSAAPATAKPLDSEKPKPRFDHKI